MRAIATYRRVSKKEQARDTDAYERQGWQLDQEMLKYPDHDRLTFQDIQSGRRDDRPDFMAMERAIREKRVGMLIVSEIKRLSRDVEKNAQLQKLLELHDVKVYEILLGRFLDFKNPNDWAYFVKSGMDGESESRMLSARVQQTFQWHRSQGKMGGGRVGFPYRRSPDNGFIEPHPDQWDTAIEIILTVLEEGSPNMNTIIKMREDLGMNRTRTWLSEWVRSPLLRGHTPQNTRHKNGNVKRLPEWDLVRDTHVSLFSDPRLKGAEKQIDQMISDGSRRRGATRKQTIYPLSGLIYCDRCGETCHIKKLHNKKYPDKTYYYVMCSGRAGVGKNCGGKYGNFKGQKRTINTTYSEVEEAVNLALADRAEELVSLAIVDTVLEPTETPEIIALRSSIQRLNSMNDPDLADTIADKTQRLNRLILGQESGGIDEADRLQFIQHFSSPENMDTLSDAEKREIYQDWISKISVDRSKITVFLKV
jgi:site-specific DNA recombinase